MVLGNERVTGSESVNVLHGGIVVDPGWESSVVLRVEQLHPHGGDLLGAHLRDRHLFLVWDQREGQSLERQSGRAVIYDSREWRDRQS